MGKAEGIQKFIRRLTSEVKAGTMTPEEAQRLALAALSEVAQTPQPEADTAAPAPEAAAPEPAKPATPTQTPHDAKNQLLGLLTQFEQAVAATWESFQNQVTQALQASGGDVGNLSIDAGDASARLKLEEKGPNQVNVIYTMRKEWSVNGLTLPEKSQASAVDPTCHMPIRRSILAVAEDILDAASSDLAWQRSKLPVTSMFKMRETAFKERDNRAASVLSGIPDGGNLADREEWQRWALASQVYLVGADFAEDRTFSDVKESISVEESL